jgi:hypothetical protein
VLSLHLTLDQLSPHRRYRGSSTATPQRPHVRAPDRYPAPLSYAIAGGSTGGASHGLGACAVGGRYGPVPVGAMSFLTVKLPGTG